jgi:competence protein ComEA
VSSFTVSRRRALAAALLVVGTLLVAGRLLVHAGASTAPPAEARLRPAPPAPRPLVTVHVVGAVRRPGLYRLRDGARIADAVRRAGGATHRAELALINLAAPLADGAQVVVPRRAMPAAPNASVAEPGSPAPGTKVSLNQATLEQLDALPGVGPVTAQKIIDFRREHGAIATVDELDAVPGIGPARLEQLRELVTP